MSQITLTAEKLDYIFEETLNLQLASFFSFPLWIPVENRAKLKKLFNLNSRLTWEHNTSDTQNTSIVFLSPISVMQVIF